MASTRDRELWRDITANVCQALLDDKYIKDTKLSSKLLDDKHIKATKLSPKLLDDKHIKVTKLSPKLLCGACSLSSIK
jgi:hypothetical protein